MDIANSMAYLVVIVLIVLGIGGLIVTHRAAQKEQQKRLLQSKCKRLLERADDVIDTAKALSGYTKNADAIDALFKYYSYYLHQRQQLLPQADTATLLSQVDALKSQLNTTGTAIKLTDDNEINRCKQSFKKAIKILGACVSKHFIDNASFDRMRNDLKYDLLQLEVTAYERLGDLAGEKKNPAVATNYYKYAKKILIETDMNFDGKHEHIREITRKNQLLFGNIVKEKIEEQIEQENTNSEYGFSNTSTSASEKAKSD